MTPESALAWGLDWARVDHPNRLIRMASWGVQIIGGLLVLLAGLYLLFRELLKGLFR